MKKTILTTAAILAAVILCIISFTAGQQAGIIHAATESRIDVFPTFDPRDPATIYYTVLLDIDGRTYAHEADSR